MSQEAEWALVVAWDNFRAQNDRLANDRRSFEAGWAAAMTFLAVENARLAVRLGVGSGRVQG